MKLLILSVALACAVAEEVRLLDLEPTDAQQIIESQDQTLKYAPKIETNVPAVRYLGNEPHNVLEDIYLAKQYHGQDGLGGYLYGYSVPDISKTEKKKAGGDLRGAYNYIAGNGQEIKVEYWDDGTGFHQIDNVPKILPKQIDDSPEVKAAKEKFLARWHEEAERNQHPVQDPYAKNTVSSGQSNYPHQTQNYGPKPQFSGQFPQVSGSQSSNQYQQNPTQGASYQPIGSSHQSVGQYQPAGQYSQQSGSYQTPSVGQPQGAYGSQQPSVGGGHQQTYGQQQGTYGGQQPSVGQQQAGGFHQQQSSGGVGQQQAGGGSYQQPSSQGQYGGVGQQQGGGQAQYQLGQQQQSHVLGVQGVHGGQGVGQGQYGQHHQGQGLGSQGQHQAYGQYQGSQSSPQATYSGQNQVDYSGQYSENSNTYAQGGNAEQEDTTGPPKGFFYSFDYPVGIIVQKNGGVVKREGNLKDVYDSNKATYEAQLQNGNGASSSYLVH